MGRFRTLTIPIELVGVLVDAVNDRKEDLARLIASDGMGLAETELRAERRAMERLLEFLEE